MAGNANSGPKREKPFIDALKMELAAAGEDHKALRRIARRLIAIAERGEEKGVALSAIKEIADRLDGKATQYQEIAGAEGGPLVPIINITGRPEPSSSS